MPTVNFSCGNCGRLVVMAEEQLIGQRQLCPNCGQAMQNEALAPAGPAPQPGELPSTVSFATASVEEHESIFHSPQQGADALFGETETPKVELPREAPALPPPAETPLDETLIGPLKDAGDAPFGSEGFSSFVPSEPSPVEAPPPPSSLAALAGLGLESSPVEALVNEPALPPAPEASEAGDLGTGPSGDQPILPASATEPAAVTAAELPFMIGSGAGPSPVASDSATALATEPFPTSLPRRASYSSTRGGLFIALVMVPLFSYSVFATLAVVILYLRPPQPSLEYLPDVDGDFRGAKHQKQVSISYKRPDPDMELPDRLRIRLGQSLQLGDVKVIPQKVELRRITIQRPDLGVEQAAHDSLILHLVLQNVSEDVEFCPVDPCFDRQWKSSQENKPYTFLEVDGQRFYGGPLPWRPGRRSDSTRTIEGQTYKTLQPGEQLATLVCTDPTDQVGKILANYHGRLLYRVQVRRGLVRVGDREVPATAVVGVEFSDTDIDKSG